VTTPRLREELQRIGDSAPVASVPTDTWARARAYRRRTIAGGAVAAAACVALVAGLAVGVTGEDKSQPPVTDSGTPGVPDRIETVPSDVTQREEDLAVGRSAAAFLTDDGLPVVIGATDGRYHLLDLPDATGSALALSPDGELLGYATTSGVAVLDLTTGELRSDVDTSDLYADPPEAEQLDFATGFGILVWAGADPTTSLAGRVVIGTDDPAPGGSLPDRDAVWAATEEGGFVGVGTARAWFHDGATDWKRRIAAQGTSVAIHAVTPAVLDLRHDGDRYRLYRHDATTEVELDLPVELPAHLTVIGWLPDSRMVAVDENGHLMVVKYGDQPALSDVGQVTAETEHLTLATDLMTGDRLTVHRQPPDWP
jgi:hypothetical protein